MSLICRAAGPDDLETIARIWEDGWGEAHRTLVPPELIALRTSDSFRRRAAEALRYTRVIEDRARILGFWMVRDDEVYQFYVDADARGTGVAQALMSDALAALRDAGVSRAWLHCAIGNDRARRFYERSGWTLARTEVGHVDTLEGPFELQLWRLEIALSSPSGQARTGS